LERPTCTAVCHADECRDNAGANVCTDGPCFRTQRGENGALTCSKETETTPGGDQHCCDGLPTPPALTAADDGKKYVVLARADLVSRACVAFGAGDACTGASAHAGTKALVLEVNETTRTCTAFVPRAQDSNWDQEDLPKAPTSATFTLPFFALFVNDTIDEKFIDLGEENPFTGASGTTADGYNTVITRTSDESRFPKGWFVNMVKYTWVEQERWIEWSMGARSKFSASFIRGNRSVWISDQPQLPKGDCVDASFVDDLSNTCADYKGPNGDGVGAWCTEHAVPTDAGRTHWNSVGAPECPDAAPAACRMPGGKTTDEVRIANTNAAGFQCCQCGGGSHADPESSSTMFYQ